MIGCQRTVTTAYYRMHYRVEIGLRGSRNPGKYRVKTPTTAYYRAERDYLRACAYAGAHARHAPVRAGSCNGKYRGSTR